MIIKIVRYIFCTKKLSDIKSLMIGCSLAKNENTHHCTLCHVLQIEQLWGDATWSLLLYGYNQTRVVLINLILGAPSNVPLICESGSYPRHYRFSEPPFSLPLILNLYTFRDLCSPLKMILNTTTGATRMWKTWPRLLGLNLYFWMQTHVRISVGICSHRHVCVCGDVCT